MADAPTKMLTVTPAGGWGVDSEHFSITYQPTRHADRFVRSWLDLASAEVASSHAARRIMEQFGHVGAAGDCTRCHSVDAHDGRWEVQWTARSGVDRTHALTWFSHAPHLVAVGHSEQVFGDDSGGDAIRCVACHRMDERHKIKSNFQDENGKTIVSNGQFVSNFRPMTTADCAMCHNQDQAAQHCTLCHDYHGKPVDMTKSRQLLR